MALVVAGEGSGRLATGIAKALGAPLFGLEFKTFPDGEDYARLLGDVRGQEVVLVQTTFPPARLWRLFLALDACREAGATAVRAVVPYLAYARQDRVFQPGEALSVRVVAETLSRLAAQVVSVDVHKDEIRRFFRTPFTSVSASAPVAAELGRLGVQIVLAPDAGARVRAEAIAKQVGAQHDHLEKKRISSEVVEVVPKNLDVRGKRVAIVDDIISTGATMAKALEQLRRNGAREVYAVGVHGLFLGDAVAKLTAAGAREIFATDTVETSHSRVSVAEPITEALRASVPAVPRP